MTSIIAKPTVRTSDYFPVTSVFVGSGDDSFLAALKKVMKSEGWGKRVLGDAFSSSAPGPVILDQDIGCRKAAKRHKKWVASNARISFSVRNGIGGG